MGEGNLLVTTCRNETKKKKNNPKTNTKRKKIKKKLQTKSPALSASEQSPTEATGEVENVRPE